jgi:hypothetical protein
MDKKITYGIVGTISMLLIFGGYLILTDDELDKAWYCDVNDRIGIFEYLSSTNKTGYWFEDGVRKQSTCTHSQWIPLRDYCEQQGIKDCKKIPKELIEDNLAKNDVFTGKFLCRDVCEPLYE